MTIPTIIALLSLAADPITIGSLRTNYYTNTLSTLKVTSVPGLCPECGQPNHHEIRAEHVEIFYVVIGSVVANGQTNPPTVIYKSAAMATILTNTFFRDWQRPSKYRQPGQTNPIPPLP